MWWRVGFCETLRFQSLSTPGEQKEGSSIVTLLYSISLLLYLGDRTEPAVRNITRLYCPQRLKLLKVCVLSAWFAVHISESQLFTLITLWLLFTAADYPLVPGAWDKWSTHKLRSVPMVSVSAVYLCVSRTMPLLERFSSISMPYSDRWVYYLPKSCIAV